MHGFTEYAQNLCSPSKQRRPTNVRASEAALEHALAIAGGV